jgi:hypothetical protein
MAIAHLTLGSGELIKRSILMKIANSPFLHYAIEINTKNIPLKKLIKTNKRLLGASNRSPGSKLAPKMKSHNYC